VYCDERKITLPNFVTEAVLPHGMGWGALDTGVLLSFMTDLVDWVVG
jgi:hypothetical protein